MNYVTFKKKKDELRTCADVTGITKSCMCLCIILRLLQHFKVMPNILLPFNFFVTYVVVLDRDLLLTVGRNRKTRSPIVHATMERRPVVHIHILHKRFFFTEMPPFFVHAVFSKTASKSDLIRSTSTSPHLDLAACRNALYFLEPVGLSSHL